MEVSCMHLPVGRETCQWLTRISADTRCSQLGKRGSASSPDYTAIGVRERVAVQPAISAPISIDVSALPLGAHVRLVSAARILEVTLRVSQAVERTPRKLVWKMDAGPRLGEGGAARGYPCECLSVAREQVGITAASRRGIVE
mmetsp:Transcript_27126/g.82223  ORF Transcript_27126/g.82223 Transcript_27126/m.82223 type:complete len:143 (-) Transcript_27126:1529-1957(-)